jgi:hypothetical protein
MIAQRDVLLLAALVAIAATPAWAQALTVAPAGDGTQGAASIPDFSGIWSHPSFPGFEPPASGPGPVVNKSRRPQVNFDGRILPAENDVRVSNPAQLVGDYTNPILKPHAAEAVKRKGEMELGGMVGPTPTIQCWPEPVPYIFNGVAMQMLQQADKIIFLYPNDHQVRYVRMNVAHPAQVTPSWYGDSVGHYEGDTLVIDTVGSRSGLSPWLTFTALRTPRLYMSWNAIGCSITKPRKKDWTGTQGRICAPRWAPMRDLHPTTATGASTCNSVSWSRMRASSRCRGRPPSRTGVGAKNGGKLPVLRT